MKGLISSIKVVGVGEMVRFCISGLFLPVYNTRTVEFKVKINRKY